MTHCDCHGLLSYYCFSVNVDYSGQWGGVASNVNGTPTVATWNGPGVIVSETPDANSTFQLTVTKLHGSGGGLAATFDSITNTTIFPYGSVALSGTPYYYTNIAGSLPFKT